MCIFMKIFFAAQAVGNGPIHTIYKNAKNPIVMRKTGCFDLLVRVVKLTGAHGRQQRIKVV